LKVVSDLNRRSKIEICIEILSILDQRGLSRITHIMYNTNTNCSLLKEILIFMIKQDLVQEKSVGKDRLAYCITQRGLSILKAFQELNQILPIVETESEKISAYA
jgi:predicted transcriptional regulator